MAIELFHDPAAPVPRNTSVGFSIRSDQPGLNWPPRAIQDVPSRMRVWSALAILSGVAGAYWGAKARGSTGDGVFGAVLGSTLPIVGPALIRWRWYR